MFTRLIHAGTSLSGIQGRGCSVDFRQRHSGMTGERGIHFSHPDPIGIDIAIELNHGFYYIDLKGLVDL